MGAIAERLKEQGIKKETLHTIELAPVFERAKTYRDQVKRAIASANTDLIDINNAVLRILIESFPAVETFDEMKALDSEVFATKTRIKAHIEAAIAETTTLAGLYNKSSFALDEREKLFRTDYAAAVAAQHSHKQLIAEHERIAMELRSAEKAEVEAAESEAAKRTYPSKFETARSDLAQLIAERERELSLAAYKVEGQSSKMLKAKHKRDPEPREFVEGIEALMNGARVHDVREKSQDWVRELIRPDANPNWETVKRELLNLYRAKIAAGSSTDPSEEHGDIIRRLIFSKTDLTNHQVQRVYQNIDDDCLATIFAAVPRDFIAMTYVDQGRDVPFEQASPGQQASALLELLLRQSAGTLIIDQPEDDLDNRVIMQVVSLIRTSKSRRQLLFATHNPNIVVNGDADKVIALKSGESELGREKVSARIQIDVDGAIETPDVRRTITHLMEGGKDAFDLRNRKYNFSALAD